MNLLLLLSALLSALSGAGGPARVSQAPVAVARTAEVAVARQARAAVAGRPMAALPALADLAGPGVRPAWRLAVIEPAYASRRRE